MTRREQKTQIKGPECRAGGGWPGGGGRWPGAGGRGRWPGAEPEVQLLGSVSQKLMFVLKRYVRSLKIMDTLWYRWEDIKIVHYT